MIFIVIQNACLVFIMKGTSGTKTYLAQFIGQFALGKTGMNTMLVNMLEDFSSMKKF